MGVEAVRMSSDFLLLSEGHPARRPGQQSAAHRRALAASISSSKLNSQWFGLVVAPLGFPQDGDRNYEGYAPHRNVDIIWGLGSSSFESNA